jgi:MYXO-CTERM domain-containing protein
MPVVLFLSLLVSLPSHPVLDRLEPAVARGQITPLQKLEIMEDAVRNPDGLTEPWRTLVKTHPVHPELGTAWLVEAYQARVRQRLLPIAGYPAELQYHLDSELVPVRVYYDSDSQIALARLTLAAAETSWIAEIDGFGFYAPPLTTPEGRYRIYIGDTGMGGGGYCSPIGGYTETPWDDCQTYVVIDQRNPRYYIDSLVAHELNHATQGAMDCLEPVSFWENTATYMKFAVYPTSLSYVRYYMDYFQSMPYWSVAGGDSSSLYWYGGFVWAYFLAERFGDPGQGAIFLREIWERGMQETNMMRNSPHYFEALDDLLRERGQGSLHEAFHEFSRVRWFVDENASETYSGLPDPRYLTPAPLLTASVQIDMPQLITPQKTVWPRPYGVNYYRLEAPSAYRRDTTVTLTGEGLWYLQLVQLTGDAEVIHSDLAEGAVTLSFTPRGRALLIVEHIGDPDFEPGNNPREGREYTLRIESTVPLPVISTVTPSSAWQGTEVTVQVYGTHFQEGATARFSPDNLLEVLETTFVSDGQLTLRVRIPENALTGPYGLTVTNPDQGTAWIERSVFVIRKQASDSDGCATSGAPATSGPRLGWVVLGALLLSLRRRRRVRA